MSDGIILLVYQAREAAAKAGVRLEELRLNRLAHMLLLREQQYTRDWDFAHATATSDGQFMKMALVIEYPEIPPLEAFSDLEGRVEVVERPTVCVAGRGALGRWQYFDAHCPPDASDGA